MKNVLKILLLPLCLSLHAASLDLSGKWAFQLDPADRGIAGRFWEKPFDDTIRLPGTTAQARKGEPLALQARLPASGPERLNLHHGLIFGRDRAALSNSPLAHLYQRFSYIGPAWYRRSVEIPKGWAGKDIQLVLERVLWQSQVWVNGRFMGARDSLTTPHRYDLGAALHPGRNELVIRIDNRRQLAIGDPHAYTQESQTIWNGIIGRIELVARDRVRINRLQLRPDLARGGVAVTVFTHNGRGRSVDADLRLRAVPDNFRGKSPADLPTPIRLAPGDASTTVFYPMGTNVELWSEFNPKLYRMEAALGPVGSGTQAVFGMREFARDGRQFTINGRPVFLRGTVNCCEFPKTGYPDMTGKQWKRIFDAVKAYGLNHIRFHTWCPPEIAFQLADRCGVYLEVELPDWCFKIGQDTNVTAFFRAEGERMIREYGNHPAWVMFTMGNELKGDYGVLAGLEEHFRRLDPELLYDSTTYPSSAAGKTNGPADDYYISQDTQCGRARGQGIFEDTPPNTQTNYEQAVACVSVPFVSHEVGQYCIYPDLAEIPKYNGVLRAVGFEAIRADLKKKGRLAEAPLYTRDSGKLAALLYKEEIERALRTPGQAGFQLLELNDFPGQGTSTVGLLNAFWQSKGLISPGEFRRFCAPVVPLLLLPKRVYQNNEALNAGVEIANFGRAPIREATLDWVVFDGRKKIGSGSFKGLSVPLGHGHVLGHLRLPLAAVTRPARLTVTLRMPGTAVANDWAIWVYPAREATAPTQNVMIFHKAGGRFYRALRDGKRVVLLPSESEVKSPLAAQFTPVFWNPVMFPNQPGSMGAMIDARHPVFSGFPTEDWTDWQWWELLHRSFAVDLEQVHAKIAMPFRFVDKFNRNALPCAIFEARVGAGRLLVCTLDISGGLDHRIAARQLRRSLLDYAASDRFKPRGELEPAALRTLFR